MAAAKKAESGIAQLLLGSVPASADSHCLYLDFKFACQEGEHQIAPVVREALRSTFSTPGSQLAILLGGSSANFEKRFNFGKLDEDTLRLTAISVAGKVWYQDVFETAFHHSRRFEHRLDKRSRGRNPNVRDFEQIAPIGGVHGFEGGFKVTVDLEALTVKTEMLPTNGKAIGPEGWAASEFITELTCRLWLIPPVSTPLVSNDT